MPLYASVTDSYHSADVLASKIAKLGVTTSLVMPGASIKEEMFGKFDMLVCTMDSRQETEINAFNYAYNRILALKKAGAVTISKCIERNLSGNIAAELAGTLEALGAGSVAFVVLTDPEQNINVVGGQLFIDGVEFSGEEYGKRTSAISDYFQHERLHTENVFANDVTRGSANLKNVVENAVKNGINVLIFDAKNIADINEILNLASAYEQEFICVDMGYFTRRIVEKRCKGEPDRVLAVLSSAQDHSSRQALEFIKRKDVCSVYVNTKKLVVNPAMRREEITRCVQSIITIVTSSVYRNYRFVALIADSVDPKRRIPFPDDDKKFEEDLIQILYSSMAEIAFILLTFNDAFKGVFVNGHDTAMSLYRKLGVSGLVHLNEIEQDVYYTRLIGGQRNMLHAIAKSGNVGEQDAFSKCINYLYARLIGDLFRVF